MDLTIHLLAVLARNRFLMLPVSLVLCVAVGTALRRWTGHSPAWGALALLLAVLNVMAGPYASAWLIHRFERTAEAQTIGSFGTLTRDNGRNVRGHDVAIRLSKTEVVAERFEDDDYNLYPISGHTLYPQPGDTYNVRVLPDFPHDFVVLTDDDSSWARRVACGRLGDRLTEARRRYTFAAGAPSFRAPYTDAITAYVDRGCANGPEDVDLYRRDKARVASGLVDP